MKKILALSAVIVFCIASILYAKAKSTTEKSKTITIFSNDKNKKGWLGVTIDNVYDSYDMKKKLKINYGVIVTSIEDDSPAERAGMQEDDVIITFNKNKIEDSGDLVKYVRATKPKTDIPLEIIRDGKNQTMTVTIGSLKEYHSPNFSFELFASHFDGSSHNEIAGMTVQDIGSQLAEFLELPGSKGVFVMEVHRGSKADDAGIKAGDALVKVNTHSIWDAEDLWETLREFRDESEVLLEIYRKGKLMSVKMKIDEDDFSFLEKNDIHIRGEMKGLNKELQQLQKEMKNNFHQMKKQITVELDEL
jgi:serine protease Do